MKYFFSRILSRTSAGMRPGAAGRSARATLLAMSLLAAGCSRLDMQDQPKYRPQRPSDFFADGRSERQPVEGSIARGALNEDTAFYEGKDAAGKDIEAFPIAVDKPVILRGQQRYDIYCAPCHGRIGNGLGMIVRRGFKQPPSYHIDRLRDAPVGHYYDVISNGYGAMLNYASQVQPRDRWAIVAYIRALQYSENANINDLPAEARSRVPAAGTAPSEAQRNEPIAPADSDFANFPAKPATPAGVPGAHGAGAEHTIQPGSQPER
jgi:mono/diheme cytochrome c family protein